MSILGWLVKLYTSKKQIPVKLGLNSDEDGDGLNKMNSKF